MDLSLEDTGTGRMDHWGTYILLFQARQISAITHTATCLRSSTRTLRRSEGPWGAGTGCRKCCVTHFYNPMERNRLISGLHPFTWDLICIVLWDAQCEALVRATRSLKNEAERTIQLKLALLTGTGPAATDCGRKMNSSSIKRGLRFSATVVTQDATVKSISRSKGKNQGLYLRGKIAQKTHAATSFGEAWQSRWRPRMKKYMHS